MDYSRLTVEEILDEIRLDSRHYSSLPDKSPYRVIVIQRVVEAANALQDKTWELP